MHLCVDMQRLFAEETEWNTPWMRRVLPQVIRLCERDPARTCFTRFVPAERPGDGEGTWRRYYEDWAAMTIEGLGPDMIRLLPELEIFTPPARIFDKTIYSPWPGSGLGPALAGEGVETLVVSGGETDVCVLATVLGAVDAGYRTIVAVDALCSSSDPTHDAVVTVMNRRFSKQIETATVDEILEGWI